MAQAPLETDYSDLLEFLYMCPIGVMKLLGDGTVQLINPHAVQLLLPLAPQPFIQNLFDVLQNWAPELRNLSDHFAGESGIICKDHHIVLRRQTGGPRVLSCTLLKIGAECLMCVVNDVSEQVELEARLRQTESWFAALVSNVTDFALFNLDEAGRITRWNASGLKQTGYTAEDVAGQTLFLLHDKSSSRPSRVAEQLDCARHEGWHLDEGWCCHKNGTRFWAQILVAALDAEDGSPDAFSVVLRDSTERRITTDELRRMITTDHLTGLTNRAHFTELAGREVARSKRYRHPLGLIVIDIDHFKTVNDTYGHIAGDHILRHVAQRCRDALRSSDILARFGGEEFLALLPETSLTDAAMVAGTLRATVADALVDIDGTPVAVTISAGCAVLDQTDGDLEALIEAADAAMYQAKRLGRNRVELSLPANTEQDRVVLAAD